MGRAIVYRRFKGKAFCGEDVNFPYGSEFPIVDQCHVDFVTFPDGRIINRVYSDDYCKHFSRNDDGQGLIRGKLAYAIAYSPRECVDENTGFVSRLSQEERETLRKEWPMYIVPNASAFLFNDLFYDAPVEHLQKIADYLNIKPKE